MSSGRGGVRPNSGRPAKYGDSETCTIRIPKRLKSKIEDMVSIVSNGGTIDFDTKTIDLTNVKVYKLHGFGVIRTKSLEELGYKVIGVE